MGDAVWPALRSYSYPALWTRKLSIKKRQGSHMYRRAIRESKVFVGQEFLCLMLLGYS